MSVEVQTIQKGDRVRAEREAPARGTWRRYAGKTGEVVQVIRGQRSSDGDTVVVNELQVSFDKTSLVAWFRPDELVLIGRRKAL